MGKRKHIPSGRFHRLSQNTGVFFQLHLGVPNHGSRQSFFQRHTDAIGKVVRLVHHDDDVLQGKIHGFETGLTHAVIEQVIVIADEDVCVADGFARCFPRTGLCRLSVNGVGSADVHEFVNVQGRGEDALLQSRCGCDPRFAGTSFSGLTAQQREHQRGLFGKGLDAHACLAHHVHQADGHRTLSSFVDAPNGVDHDAMLSLARREKKDRFLL